MSRHKGAKARSRCESVEHKADASFSTFDFSLFTFPFFPSRFGFPFSPFAFVLSTGLFSFDFCPSLYTYTMMGRDLISVNGNMNVETGLFDFALTL